MKVSRLLPLAALDVLFASSVMIALSQPVRSDSPGRISADSESVSGLSTERISARNLPRWQAIERLVLAEDASGQPLHPTLRSLYEWVEASGHSIYIELITESRSSSCTAGNFSIEHFDPKGERHKAVIRLYLANIDQAYIGDTTQRPDGLIPFKGLKKEERYAEVLGHELAHAVDILSDLEKVRQVEEVVEQTNELLLKFHSQRASDALTPELEQRLSSRDKLLHKLEKRAESIEAIVWHELSASQMLRSAASDNTTAARR